VSGRGSSLRLVCRDSIRQHGSRRPWRTGQSFWILVLGASSSAQEWFQERTIERSRVPLGCG
jgi:hypothetical protein